MPGRVGEPGPPGPVTYVPEKQDIPYLRPVSVYFFCILTIIF